MQIGAWPGHEYRLRPRELSNLQILTRVRSAPFVIYLPFIIIVTLCMAGYQHSSFLFAQESAVTKTSVAGAKIPPGSLITHLQRALNYAQAEIALLDVGISSQ
jgi:hypothetical protein